MVPFVAGFSGWCAPSLLPQVSSGRESETLGSHGSNLKDGRCTQHPPSRSNSVGRVRGMAGKNCSKVNELVQPIAECVFSRPQPRICVCCGSRSFDALSYESSKVEFKRRLSPFADLHELSGDLSPVADFEVYYYNRLPRRLDLGRQLCDDLCRRRESAIKRGCPELVTTLRFVEIGGRRAIFAKAFADVGYASRFLADEVCADIEHRQNCLRRISDAHHVHFNVPMPDAQNANVTMLFLVKTVRKLVNRGSSVSVCSEGPSDDLKFFAGLKKNSFFRRIGYRDHARTVSLWTWHVQNVTQLSVTSKCYLTNLRQLAFHIAQTVKRGHIESAVNFVFEVVCMQRIGCAKH